MQRNRYWLARLAVLGCILTCLALAGCGAGKADLSGTVTYQGKPLPGGIVVLIPEQGGKGGGTAPIQKDGTFSFTGIIPGKMLVAVQVPHPPADSPMYGPKGVDAKKFEEMKKPPKVPEGVKMPENTQWVSDLPVIPKRYEKETTSGLSIELKSGKNPSYAIDLKD
jgi:hypothetical protein